MVTFGSGFSTQFDTTGVVIVITITDNADPLNVVTRNAYKYEWPAVDGNNNPITVLQYSPKQNMTGVTVTALNLADAQLLADRLIGRMLSVHKKPFSNGVA